MVFSMVHSVGTLMMIFLRLEIYGKRILISQENLPVVTFIGTVRVKKKILL